MFPSATEPEVRKEAKRLFQAIERAYSPRPANETLEECLRTWKSGSHLDFQDARRAFEELLRDDTNELQIGKFLFWATPEFLHVEEIAGFAEVLRERAETIRISTAVTGGQALGDTCGTGGDTVPTFNVSTTIMFVLAAANTPIAKHGNRAFTSRCGSADVLKELGVAIDLTPNAVSECLRRVNIGFMYAPVFHKATKKVADIRRILATELPDSFRKKTVFNILGPLSNPAHTPWQLIGVYSPSLTERIAQVLDRLRVKRAFVVHGQCADQGSATMGLDEVSTLGPTQVVELNDGHIQSCVLTPDDFGLRQALPHEIVGGDIETNAKILEGVLTGKVRGARRDIVLANAAVGLYLGDRSSEGVPLRSVLRDYVQKAADLIDSGAAHAKLVELQTTTRELARRT